MKYKLFLVCPTTEASGVKTHVLNLSMLEFANCGSIQVLFPSKNTNIAQGQINISYDLKSIVSNWITTFHFTRNYGSNSIIHLHGRLSILAFLPSIIMKQGVFVYTFHQFFDIKRSFAEKYKDKLEIFLSRRVSGRIAVSSALSKKMEDDYRIECVTIPNWLPDSQYMNPHHKTRSKSDRVFMFAGRYSIEKNPLLLLKAVKTLSREGYSNKTRFFGHGPLEKEMLQYIEENEIAEIVSINGVTNEIEKEMQSANCIVIPSLTESFGIVYLEAATNGMSAIVADIPGLNEVTSGTNAVKFKFNEVSSLVEAMISYLRESDNIIEENVLEDVKVLAEKYGSGKAGLLYNELYESLSSSMKETRNEP
jgi:glycosyltransferase involved in cell wall biosynthesis